MYESLPPYSPGQLIRCRKWSVALTMLASLIAATALIGWIFKVDALKRIHPSLVTMKANAAVCFILISIAVFLLQDRTVPTRYRRIAQCCAVLVALVGLANLSEHLFGWNLGIDQFLFTESTTEAGLSFPGRIGIPGSLDFILLGVTVLFLDRRPTRWFRISNLTLLLVASITLLVFLYYFYGIEQFEPLARYFSIALHSVIAFFSLCAAILLMRPERGIMATMLTNSAGSLVARRMWPALIVIILLGWLRNNSRGSAFYGQGFGTAIFVLVILLMFIALIWWTAISLNQTDKQRHIAAIALRYNEARLAALLEQLPVGIGLTDREGRFVIRNSILNKFVGEKISSFEPLFRSRWRGWDENGQLLDPAQWPSSKALRGESEPPVEMLYTTEDGKSIWTRVVSVPFRDQAGEMDGVIVAVQDIDEERKASEATARLASIVESSEDAIISKDLNGNILTWNSSAERIFGYTAEEVIGKSITILMPPDRLWEEPEILSRIRRGDRLEHFETIRRRKDGSLFDISITVSPITDSQGHIIGISKIARDITARKQADNRLDLLVQVSELIRRIQDPLELSNAVATALGEHLNVRRCLFNETDVERDLEVVHQDYCDGTESVAGVHKISDYSSLTSREMENGRMVVNYDSAVDARTAADYERCYKATGERSYVAVPLMRDGKWVASLWVSDNKARRWTKEEIFLIQTVGERTWNAVEKLRAEAERERLLESEKEARDAAERANQLKDDFLATLSHELRNPLNVILGYSELLLRMPEIEGSLRLSQMGKALRRNAQSQSQLINDLLDLSRLQRGKISLNRESISLGAIIDSAVETVNADAHSKKISINSAIDEDVLMVEGDRLRLQQIAWNLLNNAVKFTPAGGSIDIKLKSENEDAVLTIEDTGQGIIPEFLPHVFEMFRQADSSNSRRHGGMGIGLALVRQLVELHGGSILAESQGQGKGARFTVRLPLAREFQRLVTSKELPAPAALKVPTDTKFLVVDDSEDTIQMLEHLLKLGGGDVTTASDGAEALKIAARTKFDVILSDISMPEMDGFEFLRRLRQLKGLQNVPVIAITGFGRTDDIKRVRSAGFYSHLTKPLNVQQLAHLLEQITGRSEQQPNGHEGGNNYHDTQV